MMPIAPMPMAVCAMGMAPVNLARTVRLARRTAGRAGACSAVTAYARSPMVKTAGPAHPIAMAAAAAAPGCSSAAVPAMDATTGVARHAATSAPTAPPNRSVAATAPARAARTTTTARSTATELRAAAQRLDHEALDRRQRVAPCIAGALFGSKQGHGVGIADIGR